jgi:hypothetical protein
MSSAGGAEGSAPRGGGGGRKPPAPPTSLAAAAVAHSVTDWRGGEKEAAVRVRARAKKGERTTTAYRCTCVRARAAERATHQRGDDLADVGRLRQLSGAQTAQQAQPSGAHAALGEWLFGSGLAAQGA